MKRTFKHLTFNDRLKIEAWLKAGVSKKDMACMLGVHWRTIYNELARGQYEHLNSDYTTEMRYSPDIAEEKYQENLRAKGAGLKIGNDHEYANYLEYKVSVEKYAPGAILGGNKAKRNTIQYHHFKDYFLSLYYGRRFFNYHKCRLARKEKQDEKEI